MLPRPFLVAAIAAIQANAFLSPTCTSPIHGSKILQQPSSATQLHVGNAPQPDSPKTIEEDAALQWQLFTKNHAVDGEWWGTWSTYNYMGDIEKSTVAG